MMVRLPNEDEPKRATNTREAAASVADAMRWTPREPTEPLVEPLVPTVEPWEAFRRLAHLPHCVFFDSAQQHAELGRYSFVAADPFQLLVAQPEHSDALGELQRQLRAWPANTVAGLPPFQGGAAGVFSYDLARQLERLPRPTIDEFRLPAMVVGLYDVIVAFDHMQQQAWIISHGFPERTRDRRLRRAEQRIRAIRQWICDTPGDGVPNAACRGGTPADCSDTRGHQSAGSPSFDAAGAGRSPAARGSRQAHARWVPEGAEVVSARALAKQYDVGQGRVTSNFSRQGYLRAIERAIGYIYEGDVFQVNLSQRLLAPQTTDSVTLYEQLRGDNPSPFAGYFDGGWFQVLSSSPERFMRVANGMVETRPIKGTRRRVAHAEANLFAGDELRTSAKDRAENVMIVDLLRNDLSRVCLADSVRVEALCRLESYRFVQHLVSVLSGRLRPECGPVDLLRAAFPGGSVTGAPKVRAMEIIAELEPTARGAYCGSLGYVGFDATMDTNILIRTITAGGGWWQAPVGGGIVAQSNPEAEYEETWQKAQGLLKALRRTSGS